MLVVVEAHAATRQARSAAQGSTRARTLTLTGIRLPSRVRLSFPTPTGQPTSTRSRALRHARDGRAPQGPFGPGVPPLPPYGPAETRPVGPYGSRPDGRVAGERTAYQV